MNLGQDKTIGRIVSAVDGAGAEAIGVSGMWGSFGALLADHVGRQIGRPILYLCAHIDDANKAADDLHTFGGGVIDVFGAWEAGRDQADATDEIYSERVRVVLKVLSGGDNFIIPTSVQALCQPIPEPEVLRDGSLDLEVDGEVSPEEIIGWLIDNGFEEVDGIDLPGQFARRGGIIDIYAPLINYNSVEAVEKSSAYLSREAGAVRIEFFGDTIESIRKIDLDTLRSSGQIKSLNIISGSKADSSRQRSFLDILPAETIIILQEPTLIEEVANVYLSRAEEGDRLYNWSDIYESMGRFTQLRLSRFADSLTDDLIKVDVGSIQQFEHKAAAMWAGHKAALQLLVQQASEGKKVFLYCERAAEIKRVTEIIKQTEEKIPANFKLVQGFINKGFAINSLDTIVISHHELFGQFALRRGQRHLRAGSPIDSLADLNPSDYVVHASYGIGKFLGVRTIKEKVGVTEYLTIEYADKAKIHVAVSNIALVQKYIGTSPKRPRLSKVGSKKWQKQKEKVSESVRDLAVQLLDIQANRQATGGIAFDADSNWQIEFEESFAYQETADQTTAIEQIKGDMQIPIAMDRLLCGDVGYGKTELAMRAAFKAVESGKQVAMLVPTTVLCVQHGKTFTERFADFPISIDVLNRFKTAKQAAETIAGIKSGRLDVLIGTHRLLSEDVGFKDLGLLIIDEEQRFGVEHKEKLKRLKSNIDILTMTATPIPRTLHLSLLGLRDISSLDTPPLDRRSIVTRVTAYSDKLIKKEIIHELNRNGQVFFLHNRVKTIEKKAWGIRNLLEGSGARVAIAHGQMAKSKLEKAMIDFVVGRTDVLVCTTIIESGLDIPNANTIIIDNADRFGLAELHQLRGRVGRYKHRAYAYLLLPKSRTITPIAARRLKAIEEYSHLGAGFRIALRDLEIRGAGNILGSAQSGHIQVVGYQMYCQLLAEAVRKLHNEPSEPLAMVNLDLGFATYIPKGYIALDRCRMDGYRKIAVAKTTEDLEQIQGEFADVYGPVPEEVELMLELAGIRIAAAGQGIKSIFITGQNLAFSFTEDAKKKAKVLFANVKGSVNFPDAKTVYLRLNKNYFEASTLISLLRKIFHL